MQHAGMGVFHHNSGVAEDWLCRGQVVATATVVATGIGDAGDPPAAEVDAGAGDDAECVAVGDSNHGMVLVVQCEIVLDYWTSGGYSWHHSADVACLHSPHTAMVAVAGLDPRHVSVKAEVVARRSALAFEKMTDLYLYLLGWEMKPIDQHRPELDLSEEAQAVLVCLFDLAGTAPALKHWPMAVVEFGLVEAGQEVVQVAPFSGAAAAVVAVAVVWI